jgi:hypothetical protein
MRSGGLQGLQNLYGHFGGFRLENGFPGKVRQQRHGLPERHRRFHQIQCREFLEQLLPAGKGLSFRA